MTTNELNTFSDNESVTNLIFSTIEDNFITEIPSDTDQGSSIVFDLTTEDYTKDTSIRKGKNKAPENEIHGSSLENSISIDDDIYPFFEEAGINSSEALRELGLDVDTFRSNTQSINNYNTIPSSSTNTFLQKKRKDDELFIIDNNNIKRYKTSEPIEIDDDDDDDNACLIDLTEDNYTLYELIDIGSSDEEISLLGTNPIASSSAINGSILNNASNGLYMYNHITTPLGGYRMPIEKAINSNSLTTVQNNELVNQAMSMPRGNKSLKEAEKDLRTLLENITSEEPPSPEDRTGTPDRMNICLLEHQKIGLEWMLKMENSNNKGGILADDMGLGKTVQAISIICHNPSSKEEHNTPRAVLLENEIPLDLNSTLIICPVSLIDQWRREIETKTSPSLKVLVYHGLKRTKNHKDFALYDVIVTSYTVASTDFYGTRKGPLSMVKFHRIVLDEAHTIKNKNTRAAQGCCEIKATYRWCMTATPIQNKIEELYSLIKFLCIRPFCDWDEFRDSIMLPMRRGKFNKAIQAAHFLMKAIALRRSKKATIDGRPVINLPERKINMTHIRFSADERIHYNFVNARAQARFTKYLQAGTVMKNYSSVLVMLLRLRQACLHPSLTIQESYDPIEYEASKENRLVVARQMKPDVVQRLLSDSATIKEIECPICMDIAQDAQIMMLCGHILCQECFDNYWNALNGNMKRCPQCRGTIDKQKLVDIESFLRAHAPELVQEVEEAPPEELEDSLKLAKMISSAKIDKMMEILENTSRESNNEDKTIVFSQFTGMLTLLENPLERKGIAYLRYDGSMDVRHRAEAVNKFFDDPEVKVLLVSTKCGSLGLNLTCANRVILLDVWWNPSVENQAIDRVHRIGQKKTVEVHRIFIENSVEDRILELQKKKQSVADSVLGEGTVISNGNERLNVNELVYLFRGASVISTTEEVGDRRIVAMGDLHGDLANTLSILKFSKIIDDDQHWIAGDTIFVQTGDVVDRGLDTIKLYKLLQSLREEAPLHGGKVIPLLGNHEIMNLVGDWRYVYPGEPETFGGMEERKKAFEVDGFIGEYLTLLNMTTKVGSTVFCHGGIHPNYAQRGVDWINDQTHREIVDFVLSRGEKGDHFGVFGGHGPTWYRGYAMDDENVACPLLDEALGLMGVDRMVVGHTVQHDGRIHTRCGGKVILIDVGISSVYGGNRASLEIKGDQVTALYENKKEDLDSPKRTTVHEEL